MSITLLEAAKLVQDPLKRGVIEIFPRVSPVLERLPFFNVNGQAYKYNQEQTLPGIAFNDLQQHGQHLLLQCVNLARSRLPMCTNRLRPQFNGH